MFFPFAALWRRRAFQALSRRLFEGRFKPAVVPRVFRVRSFLRKAHTIGYTSPKPTVSIHHIPPFVTTFMYFLPTFFEFSENKRLFASNVSFRALGGVFSRHKLWYTVCVLEPDMVQTDIFYNENPPFQRFSSFVPGFFFCLECVC